MNILKSEQTGPAAPVFGAVLAEIRKSKSMSIEALATAIGVSRAYLTGVERGTREPTLIMLFRIADALDVDPSEMVAMMERKMP